MSLQGFLNRRAVLRNIGGLGLGSLVGGVGLDTVPTDEQITQSKGDYKRTRAVGSWFTLTTFPNGVKERGYMSFIEDGNFIQTNQVTRYAGFGGWVRTGQHNFNYWFREQLFDDKNQLVGEIRVSQKAVLNSNFDQFTASGKGTAYNLNGVVIGSNETTTFGTRIIQDTTEQG